MKYDIIKQFPTELFQENIDDFLPILNYLKLMLEDQRVLISNISYQQKQQESENTFNPNISTVNNINGSSTSKNIQLAIM